MTVAFKLPKFRVSEGIEEFKEIFDEYHKEWRKTHIDEPLPILNMEQRFIGSKSYNNPIRTYRKSGSIYEVNFYTPLLMDGSDFPMSSRTPLVEELEDKLAELMSTNQVHYEVICPYTDQVIGTVFLSELTADIENVMNISTYRELEMDNDDVLDEIITDRTINGLYHSSVVNLMTVYSSAKFDYEIVKYGIIVLDDLFDTVYCYHDGDIFHERVFLDEDGERYFLHNHKEYGNRAIVRLQSEHLKGASDLVGTPYENQIRTGVFMSENEWKKDLHETLKRVLSEQERMMDIINNHKREK